MTDYAAKLSAPVTAPDFAPSAWWEGTRAIEWTIRRGSPLYEYLQAPYSLDEPMRCKLKMRLNDGSLKAIITKTQLERAARHIYGLEP